NDQEGSDFRRVAEDAAVDAKNARNTNQAQGDHEEAGDGAAPQGNSDRIFEAVLGRGSGADIGPNRDIHADVAGEARAKGADQEGNTGHQTFSRRTDEPIAIGDLA